MEKKVVQEEKMVNKVQEEIMVEKVHKVGVNKKEVAKMEGMRNHNENQMYACVYCIQDNI